SLLPVCSQTAVRLDEPARSGAPRRGHLAVLQGPGAAARSSAAGLMRWLGSQTHHQAAEPWPWCGRKVKGVDGSTVLMPDPVANQPADPQNPSQKPGLGFPIARIVGRFGLATGSVLELALGQYQGKQTGENALVRSLHDPLEPEDVVLGDRSYGSYFDI